MSVSPEPGLTPDNPSLKQTAKENVLGRPLRQLAYAFSPTRIVLDKEEYCHVVDARNGKVTLVEGPTRRVLSYDETVVATRKKVVIPERCYCVVKNPILAGKVRYGDRKVRVGPTTFSLFPGEKIEKGVLPEFVLTQYEGVLVKALEDCDGHNAGDKFLVRGPCAYIPQKQVSVIRKVRAVSLSDTDGIYVQDQDTGDVTTIKGPVDYFIKPNEERYQKSLTDDELAGVGLQRKTARGTGVRVLTRQAANTSFLEDRSNALVLELEDKEVVLLYDGSESRVERGPKTVFVGPYERPKILTLSGGKPIRPGVLKVGLLRLGPDFIYDQIKVRTKDNAQIIVDVTYKWRFLADRDLKDAFSIDDFVGYAAETLSSDIRSLVAKRNFEDLHANALEYAKEAIFNGGSSRVFEENGLEIFGIDITSIVPDDPKIAERLQEAIKHNLDIYCKKIVLKATLEAERQEVEGKKLVEAERGDLIDAQNANERRLVTEQTRIEAERSRLHAEGRAAAIAIISRAEADRERDKITAIAEALSGEGGDKVLERERIASYAGSEKLIVVPTDAKIVLPAFNHVES